MRPRQSIAVRQSDSSRPSALGAPTPSSLRLGEIPTSSDIRVVVVVVTVVVVVVEVDDDGGGGGGGEW